MKYGNVFTQIIMFSLKKVDDLRAREREREEKGTTNSAPLEALLVLHKISMMSKTSVKTLKLEIVPVTSF